MIALVAPHKNLAFVLLAGGWLSAGCFASSKHSPPDAARTSDRAEAAPPDVARADGTTTDTLNLDAAPERPVVTANDAAASNRDGAWSRDGSRDWPSESAAEVGQPPGAAPAPWAGRDIGVVASKGGVVVSPTAFTIVASGSDVGGKADSFHFMHQTLTGDGEIVARVAMLGTTRELESKAGVMVRASLEPNAANVFLALVGDSMMGGRLQARSETGGDTAVLTADSNVREGQFLRIVRTGSLFTAFRSENRVTWTRIGSIDFELPNKVYVGLVTEAHSTSHTLAAQFDYATVDNLAADDAALGWRHVDVGALGGSAVFANGTLTLTALGDTFATDQEHFSGVMKEVDGPLSVVARVTGLSSEESGARVGLMFREGLTSNVSRSAAHALISVTADDEIAFQSRAAQGAAVTLGSRKTKIGAPLWLRLEKADEGKASRLTGSYSMDGKSWTVLDSATFSLAEPLMAGVIAGAGNVVTTNTATVDNLAFVSGEPGDGGIGSTDAAACGGLVAPDGGP